jgi:hypothetical protein
VLLTMKPLAKRAVTIGTQVWFTVDGVGQVTAVASPVKLL